MSTAVSTAVDTVHVVVPCGIDNPKRPSGGNAYDRRMCRELAAQGWTVVEHVVPGARTTPDSSCAAALATVLGRLPCGATVMLDGLLAPWVTGPAALADRLSLVVLVHMVPRATDDGGTSGGESVSVPGSAPSGVSRGMPGGASGAVLAAASAVVATSPWTKSRLVGTFGVPAGRVHVVEPGVDGAAIVPGTAGGGRLLCVAAVTSTKGHDILLAALAAVAGHDWDCTCAGALDLEPAFTAGLLRAARDGGIAHRVHFTGPSTGAGLDALYASADVLVLSSREESYGMVVTEALARGIPIIATDVGGISGTLGDASSGAVPGLLVPPADPEALAGALRLWMGDAQLRGRLRSAAIERRTALLPHSWEAAGARLSAVLSGVGVSSTGLSSGARSSGARSGMARSSMARSGMAGSGLAERGA